MSERPAASDWVGARGQKWSAQLDEMEATLSPVDAPLIEALRLEGPARIADIGCGGGGATRAVARQAAAGSVVQGFDISPTLVELARGRARREERTLAFDVADAATFVPRAPYDRLVSRFGVMFFDAPHAAFGNLVRWLEPWGRFAFAVWGGASDNPWLTTVRDEVARVVEVPSAAPDAPGPFRYEDADRLLALLDEAGFSELEVQDFRGSLPIGGGLAAAEAAQFALASFSSFRELLAAAGPDAHADVHRSLTDRYRQHERDGSVYMGALVRIFSGTRR